MKYVLIAVVLALSLAVIGCGGTHTASQKAAVNKDTAKAQAILKRCLTHPTALRTKAGRQAFVNCAVPPKNKRRFEQCIEKVTLSGVPTKSRLEAGGQTCIERYA